MSITLPAKSWADQHLLLRGAPSQIIDANPNPSAPEWPTSLSSLSRSWGVDSQMKINARSS
jgi:hypothetical protein